MNLVCLSGPRFVEHPTLLARGFATNAAFTVCARSRTRLTMISPPAGYSTPRFPSLNIDTLYDETDDRRYTLYYIADVWYYTTLWTLIVYIFFHLGAVGIAMFTHSWTKSSWKYIWVVPLSYILVAGVEALISGSIVGVMLGAVYKAGYYEMNTWIPCTWGFINLLVLILSSFTIQGGL